MNARETEKQNSEALNEENKAKMTMRLKRGMLGDSDKFVECSFASVIALRDVFQCVLS